MSVILDESIPGLNDLGARLDAAEASEAAEMTAAGQQQEQRDEGTDRAGAALRDETQKPAPNPTDTPAAEDEQQKAEKLKAENPNADPSQEKKSDLPGDKPADKAGDSKFAKAQQRLHKTWESVNQRKTDLDTQAQQLEQQKAELKRQQEDWQRQQSEAQSQYQPEQYEQAAELKAKRATDLHAQADGIEARAKKAEDDGDFTAAARLQDEAKKIRKAAYQQEGNAEDLKAHAEQLRKNPPPSATAREEQLEGKRKEWTMKAATDYPELAKNGSPLQQAVAGHLKALRETDRALASNPQIIYHVTRLAAAETAAARVPAMEKEMAELKAKVKEFEELTAPGGAGSAQRTTPGATVKTDDEEAAELRQLAGQTGSIPRD